ncbi:MAG: acVLRF1 family peptidyl-tRNA hydrolase [Geodermatophilaceae bacterium]
MTESGVRTVLVAPERLAGWLNRFAASHGDVEITADSDVVGLHAADGSAARCEVPFPPLDLDPHAPWQALVDHALRDRRVAVLLIRRGGYAAGIFDATTLVASKVGNRYVQGRTAAGGTSQQRFSRRRDNQATGLVGSAVEVAQRIIAPETASLTALFTGGDRPLIASALVDPRLAKVAALPRGPWLVVADPRLKVLRAAGQSARAVRITITDG